MIAAKKYLFPVAKSIRRVLHGHLHAGAVPEADHLRADTPPGCLPAVRLQRARHARRLRLASLYEF